MWQRTIREVLPGFQHLDDPQILASQFKLSDAQELLARNEDSGVGRRSKKEPHL
jgi:hypothetical protein